jgi:hypothetical protein
MSTTQVWSGKSMTKSLHSNGENGSTKATSGDGLVFVEEIGAGTSV